MASPTKRRADQVASPVVDTSEYEQPDSQQQTLTNTLPRLNKKRRHQDNNVIGENGDYSGEPLSEDDVNAIIAHLSVPKTTPKVANDYSNQNQVFDTDVTAYAKLAGPNWTYYVQDTEVVIGRSSTPEESAEVHIDLAPAKVVSRKHAVIRYVPEGRYWGITLLGRNGVKVDRVSYKEGTVVLNSGNVLDVGGVQMMFVLPGDPPQVATEFISRTHNTFQQSENSAVISNGGAVANVVPVDQQSVTLSQPPTAAAHNHQETSQAYPKGVAIITRPQIRGVENEFEQDLSKDEAKDIKPPYSYAMMITQAIMSTDDMMMSLADIYDWISTRYSFYRHSKSGWQNSIRHNLSLNKAFEKVPRKAHEPGKGMKWQITDEFRDEYMDRAKNGGKAARRRSRATSQPQNGGGGGTLSTFAINKQPASAAAAASSNKMAAASTAADSAAQPLSSQQQQASIPTTKSTSTTPKKSIDPPVALLPPEVTPSRGFPVSQLAYTPERGSTKPVPPSTVKVQHPSSGAATAAAAAASAAQTMSYMSTGFTPAPQPAHLQLAPPSSAQAQQLPSSYMPTSSPAPFWKYMQFSTPMREDSPTKFQHSMNSPSNHPSLLQTTTNSGDQDKKDKLGDLKDVDLTRGFRQIGKWRDENGTESPKA